MIRRRAIAALLALAMPLWLAGAGPAAAQQLVQSPILTIDPERLYLDSAFGQRIQAEITRRNREIAAENRVLEAELEAEEQELTDLRATIPPEDFRALADAFDARVQAIRRDREAESRAVAQMLDENRDQFERAAAPVLGAIMQQLGAAVVLDVNFVFASANAIDITARAIREIDAVLGDGTDPAANAPATGAPSDPPPEP